MTARTEKRYGKIVGESVHTKRILRLVSKVGRGRWPVLLQGETGTGKEVIARAIHSTNPSGRLVTIDCSSMVGPLMESELFGHVRGAFTGAVGAKTGLIEMANGGTAFLDEIGELPLDLQAKLLRVLQDKEFRPVGSLTSKHSDFRVLAATNRDLAREVERGTFRRDLYYRLNVVTLRLPPLRERKEDIIPLIDHFLVRYESDHRFAPEAMEALMSYDWPGNVRELENCVQRMVALNTGPLVHVGDLPSPIRNHLRETRPAMLSMAASVGGGEHHFHAASQDPGDDQLVSASSTPVDSPVLPLNEVERRAILGALEYTKGDRGVAANLLGIGRTTLYRKLKEYAAAC